MPPDLRAALLDALDLLAPVDCVGCGTAGRALCEPCRNRLRPDVHEATRDGLRVWCALDYADVARRAIAAYKDAGRTDLARALAGPLRSAVAEALRHAEDGPGIEIVAVPSSRAAWRRRGFRPVERLLQRAGLRTTRVLRASASRADQVGLGSAERQANAAGSFAMRRSSRSRRSGQGGRRALAGRRFLVVDDILTTGATVREATRAIEAAGGSVAGIAVLAETRKRVRN